MGLSAVVFVMDIKLSREHHGGEGPDCWCLESMVRTWFSPGAIGRGEASFDPELGA